MKCKYCGNEIDNTFAFCSNCGAPAQEQEPEPTPNPAQEEPPKRNEAAERILPALKSGRFLAICVLLSVSLACTLFAGSMDVLVLLTMIFMWLVYAGARNSILNVKQMRNVSGTVYAGYVVSYVVAGAFALAGVTIGGMASTLPGSLQAFQNELIAENPSAALFLSLLFTAPGIVIAVICLLAATAVFLLNLLGYGKIHALAKSSYESIAAGDLSLIRHARGAKGWLWAFGIMSALGALSSLTSLEIWSAFGSGCQAAAYIVAATLIHGSLLSSNEEV